MPQLIQVIKDPDPEGVSPTMYAISIATFALWTAYGAIEKVWPLVVSNSACLVLTSAIFVTTVVRQHRAADRPDISSVNPG